MILIGGDGRPSGVPRHILHLATALRDTSEMTVFSDVNEGGFDGLDAVGATHVTVPDLQSRVSLSHLWRAWSGLTKVLRSHPADLVWLHARLPVLLGRLALTLRVWHPAGRVAVTYHGLPFGPGHRPATLLLSTSVEKVLLSLCPPLDLIFLSDSMAHTMRTRMGKRRMARHRVHILPNSSNLGPLPPAAQGRERRLVMTGRAGWQKNYALAARLLAHLPKDFTLTLCGMGTDTAVFRDHIAAQVPPDVAARIFCKGSVNDVRPLLMEADGYLLTSRYEGMPIGTLEAFEAGLPIILSNFDGAQNLVAAHPCGLMLDLDDLARDALAIVALVDGYRANAPEMRAAIHAVWAANWSPEIFATRARALVDTMVPGHKIKRTYGQQS